jgi:predicted nuclease of predicted toxin-antitoxin system
MDHHVPAAIVAGLRRRGVEVVTSYEDGTATWDDKRLLERATELKQIVFTQDDDFLVETHEWLRSRRPFWGVVYGHQQRITIGQAVRDLELIAKVMDESELVNQVLYVPLR